MARDITKLHPYVQEMAAKLVAECKKQGLIIKITDCVRTKEEQNGIDASRTNAKYPKSYHNWGLAFDFCRNDGKGAYEDKDGFFTKVGRIGQKLGLQWGGECFGKSLIDKPHFHTIKFGTYNNMIQWYKDPSVYFRCWTLTAPKQAVTPTSKKDDVMWMQFKFNENINAGLTVDGVYGKNSANALKKFYDLNSWVRDNKFTGYWCGNGTIKILK